MRTIAISSDVEAPTTGVALDHATIELGDQSLRFELTEVAEPELDPRDPDLAEYALVQVRAFSLNYRDRALMIVPELRQYVAAGIGSELAGVVVAAGPEAMVAVGDRVMANMAYPDSGAPGVPPGVITNTASAERAIFHSAKLQRIPEGMDDPTAAAFVLCAQTAASLVRRSDPQPGDGVLVTAPTSNTSRFAIELLRGYDVRTFGLTRSAGDAAQLGLPDSIRLLNVSAPDTLGRLVNNPDFEGFDVMIDPFADVYLPWAGSLLGMGGRYITCGSAVQSGAGSRSDQADTPTLDQLAGSMIIKNLTVMGNCLGTSGDLARAIEVWEGGNLTVPIDSVHGSDELAAFMTRSHAPDRQGKVVFVYD